MISLRLPQRTPEAQRLAKHGGITVSAVNDPPTIDVSPITTAKTPLLLYSSDGKRRRREHRHGKAFPPFSRHGIRGRENGKTYAPARITLDQFL